MPPLFHAGCGLACKLIEFLAGVEKNVQNIQTKLVCSRGSLGFHFVFCFTAVASERVASKWNHSVLVLPPKQPKNNKNGRLSIANLLTSCN